MQAKHGCALLLIKEHIKSFKFYWGKVMEYRHNFHFLLPVDRFEQLRALSEKTRVSRSELARLAIGTLLDEYKRAGEVPGIPVVMGQ